MRKASLAKPIPNAASCNALTRDGVNRKIRQPGVVLTHETLGAPVVYQNEPERQADSSPKTDKASGDDELPETNQYLEGQDSIIAQLQKIQDPHEKQRREEQSEKQRQYREPEEHVGRPREYLTRRGTAPHARQVDQASPQSASARMIWTATSDSNDGPK